MTLRVEKQIARLQISVQQVCRVHELEAFQVLVDDVLLVDVLQDVGSNNSMQVSIHEIEYEVYIAIVFSSDHILQSDYIFVASQFLQKDDLTKSSLGVCGVLKSVKVLFKGNNFLSSLINGLPDDTVCSLSCEIQRRSPRVIQVKYHSKTRSFKFKFLELSVRTRLANFCLSFEQKHLIS